MLSSIIAEVKELLGMSYVPVVLHSGIVPIGLKTNLDLRTRERVSGQNYLEATGGLTVEQCRRWFDTGGYGDGSRGYIRKRAERAVAGFPEDIVPVPRCYGCAQAVQSYGWDRIMVDYGPCEPTIHLSIPGLVYGAEQMGVSLGRFTGFAVGHELIHIDQGLLGISEGEELLANEVGTKVMKYKDWDELGDFSSISRGVSQEWGPLLKELDDLYTNSGPSLEGHTEAVQNELVSMLGV